MNRSDIAILFDHLYWLRDRILDTAEDPAVPFGGGGGGEAVPTVRDLRATLVHELDVEWSWRVRLRSDDRTEFSPDDIEFVADDFPTLASVRERWAADEAEMRDWIGGLSDEDLAGPCRADSPGTHPLWFHLQHLYTHGVLQFGDAAVILTAAGRSPGELDFLEFVEQRKR